MEAPPSCLPIIPLSPLSQVTVNMGWFLLMVTLIISSASLVLATLLGRYGWPGENDAGSPEPEGGRPFNMHELTLVKLFSIMMGDVQAETFKNLRGYPGKKPLPWYPCPPWTWAAAAAHSCQLLATSRD